MFKCKSDCSCANKYLLALRNLSRIAEALPDDLEGYRKRVHQGKFIDRDEVAEWLALSLCALACMQRNAPEDEVFTRVLEDALVEEIHSPMICGALQ